MDLKTIGAFVGIAVGVLALGGSLSAYLKAAAHSEDIVDQLRHEETALHAESKKAIEGLQNDRDRLRDRLEKLEKDEAVEVGKLQGRLEAAIADLESTKKWLGSVAVRSRSANP